MSRFVEKREDVFKTENLAGGEAWKLNPEMELYTYVCTSTLSPKFYGPGIRDQVLRICELIEQCDPVFVEKLAVFAREKMFLRTIPVVLTVECARQGKGNIRRMASRVIQRPDEIVEMLGAYAKANGRVSGTKIFRKLSNQLKRGIGDAFNKFDEYQFAKWNRSKSINLKDAMRVCHPKPINEEKSALFKKILEDNLEVPYTWEVELSRAGQEGRSKKEVWEELIESGRLPYMALLRNLRNLENANISKEHMDSVIETISSQENVLRSKQLPFRFLSSYKSVSTNGFKKALNEAVKASIQNIDFFKSTDKVLIACDVSGSMSVPVSEKSTVEMINIGLLLGMLMKYKVSVCDTGIFGTRWMEYEMNSNEPLDNVGFSWDISRKVGLSTNGYKVIGWLLKKERSYNKICFFTDCQLYGGPMNDLWKKYKRKHPQAKLYLFNLAGYGDTPVDWKNNDVTLISGWSNEIFKILRSVEDGEEVLDQIHKVEL